MAKKGSVLVVDDEEIMRDVLETLLSAEGYRVDLAKTGEDGLEAYGRRAYDVVLLDVRNRFESDAGRFEGAVVCEIENFRELPAYVDKLEELRNKKVLTYCTGGIRCEKASALLRSRGFKDVFQLHGGIVTYQEQFGNDHWQGECFVFDQRMTVRVEDGLVQIGRCAHTGRPTSRFVNCLHDLCHKLFILSEEAERENADYRLCPECLSAGITFATAEYPKSAG